MEEEALNKDIRVGVFVCHCGVNIGGVVNVPHVVEYAKSLPGVVHAEGNLYMCSAEGISRIKEVIPKLNLDRVVVASCTPRTHEPLFRASCEEAGLNKYLFEMANIREHCSWVHPHEPEKATAKAKDIVRMVVAKAILLEPQDELEVIIKPSALVIGAGISGMTAALSLANQGFQVYLVEKDKEIGGLTKDLYKLYPTNIGAKEFLGPHIEAVKNNKNIQLLASSLVKDVKGYFGDFHVTIQTENKGDSTINVGTIVVASGAAHFRPIGVFGFGSSKKVITELDLEKSLECGFKEKAKKIVMIQCVGAREKEGRTYCSRICCADSLKNAIIIKEIDPGAEVYILHRDLQAYGREFEEYYRRAQELGVRFILYLQDKPPEVSPKNDYVEVKVYNPLLNIEIVIDSDLVVLATPLVQHRYGRDLSPILKVPLGQDGFFLEAHVKLRPVDFATDGIFVCGTAHGPKSIPESMAQAYAAASRAAIPMALGKVRPEAITAFVNEDLCIGCGSCEELCPYGAHVLEKGKSKMIEALCKGCGVCAAACPQHAISMKHFTDDQILAEVHSAFSG